MTTEFELILINFGTLSKGGRVIVYEVGLRPGDYLAPVPTGILVTRVRQTSTENEAIDVVSYRGVVFGTVADALAARLSAEAVEAGR